MAKPYLSARIIGKSLSWRGFALTLLITATLVTITGFSRNPQEDNRHGEQDESIAAIRQFWKVYHGNQYDQISQVQQQLQNAIDRDPENSA